MEESKRQTWNEYFMSIAEKAATRSTCKRRKVGCVIVFNKNIIATGYNGSLPNEKHCIDDGCLVENNHCIRTVHAEMNAITRAAHEGQKLFGSTIYTTTKPCWNCFKNLISAGIKIIYYKEDYLSTNILYKEYLKTNSSIIKFYKTII